MSKFSAWMARVEAALERAVGLSSADLADAPYFDWFEDGVSPGRAATMAVKEAW